MRHADVFMIFETCIVDSPLWYQHAWENSINMHNPELMKCSKKQIAIFNIVCPSEV